jgi:hypothetical protein
MASRSSTIFFDTIIHVYWTHLPQRSIRFILTHRKWRNQVKDPPTILLSLDDFKARCNEWELSISMYPEVKILRHSQHALKQLQGVLPVLKSHVLPIGNHITRHYQQHCFKIEEPAISIKYSMEEAMTILKAAAHTLDQQTGLSFHGPPSAAQIMIDLPTRELPPDAIDPLDDFADYCVNNLDYGSSEPMVSCIKRFQNRRGETSPAKPCKHAACSWTHPTNKCYICRGPHFVNRCLHVIGLREGITAIKDNFVKQHTANDGPWKQGNDRHRPPRTPERQRVSTVQFKDQPDQRSYSNVTKHTISSIQPRTRPLTTLTPLPMTQGLSTS